MSVFTRDLPALLRRTGSEWHTTINDAPITFHGVFTSDQAVKQDTNGYAVVVQETSLIVETRLAKTLSFNQQLQDEYDNTWYMRESLLIDDGAVSKLTLAETPE